MSDISFGHSLFSNLYHITGFFICLPFFFFLGFIVVPAAFFGNLTSSLILRFMKLRVRGMLKLSILTGIGTCIFGFVVLVKCDVAQLAGVTVPYSEQANTSRFV